MKLDEYLLVKLAEETAELMSEAISFTSTQPRPDEFIVEYNDVLSVTRLFNHYVMNIFPVYRPSQSDMARIKRARPVSTGEAVREVVAACLDLNKWAHKAAVFGLHDSDPNREYEQNTDRLARSFSEFQRVCYKHFPSNLVNPETEVLSLHQPNFIDQHCRKMAKYSKRSVDQGRLDAPFTYPPGG